MRKDTTEVSKKSGIIDVSRQQLIGIMGLRGAGKSYAGESLLEKYYDLGYTCLDLWSAPNMENAFWVFARENHKKRIPITIIAPESFIIPEQEIEQYNQKHFTKQPLVKFVKIPTPTAKAESDQNDAILEIITKVILDCRDKRRILVFNPYMFKDERAMFRVLEILMRNLIEISHKYFSANTPEMLGKPYNQFTMREKNYHKQVFLIREFSELVASRLKGDKSGESTIVKKAILKFVRIARHYSIDGIIDYQNFSDAESSVRNQFDVWLIKRWSTDLAGENFKWVFDKVQNARQNIFDKLGYGKNAQDLADNFYPKIEQISKKWMYMLRDGKFPKIVKVPELSISHKQPHEKWHELTGIPLEHDMSMIKKTSATSKVSKADERELFNKMTELKKNHKWSEVKEKLSNLQEKGEINSNLTFSAISDNQLSSKYSKLKKKYTD